MDSIQQLDLTLQTAAENLALDEALAEECNASIEHPDVLRFWEADRPMVVLGRSSPLTAEVDLKYCIANDIPVVRRCSGGQTVVTGPGCLMYAVVLNLDRHPALGLVDRAHQFVLGRMVLAIDRLGFRVKISGTSDLAIGDRKFSGNSLKVLRRSLVYHGTLMYDFSSALIAGCLRRPVREPGYRRGRSHEDFVTNLEAKGDAIRRVIVEEWDVTRTLTQWPQARVLDLVQTKYNCDHWKHKVP